MLSSICKIFTLCVNTTRWCHLLCFGVIFSLWQLFALSRGWNNERPLTSEPEVFLCLDWHVSSCTSCSDVSGCFRTETESFQRSADCRRQLNGPEKFPGLRNGFLWLLSSSSSSVEYRRQTTLKKIQRTLKAKDWCLKEEQLCGKTIIFKSWLAVLSVNIIIRGGSVRPNPNLNSDWTESEHLYANVIAATMLRISRFSLCRNWRGFKLQSQRQVERATKLMELHKHQNPDSNTYPKDDLTIQWAAAQALWTRAVLVLLILPDCHGENMKDWWATSKNTIHSGDHCYIQKSTHTHF